MYSCKKCKSDFLDPLIERNDREKDILFGGVSLLCPHCGSDKIEYQKPRFCKFCGLRVSGKKDYCNDICEGLGIKYKKFQEEKRKKIEEFEVSKAIVEVDTYNKEHNTDYSYGEYFALKGLGGIIDN